MVIDVHAHYYPIRYLERIGRPELPPPSAALGSQQIGERLALLDRAGIDTQVLSISQAQPYLSEPGAAAQAAAMVNDIYVDLCEAHPGRFLAFAALPLPHVEQSLAEIARTASSSSVVGVTIGCSVAGRHLDDPVFEPVFAELGRRGACVFLHPVGLEDDPLLAGRNLAWLVGAPFEDTVAALRLIMSGVTARHPGIRFIVPHLGGVVSVLMARLRRLDSCDVAAGLRSMYADTVSAQPDAFGCACRTFGADHLLFGTDYPYCNEAEFLRHLSYLDECGLDGAALRHVRGGGAAELLGLAVRG